MFACRVRGILLLCLGSTLIGCTNQGLNSVQVTPAAQSLAVGQTVQFTATGTYGSTKNLTTQNITSSVTWTSSVPAVATVSAAGVATAVGAGTTTITANATGWTGNISSSGTLTVTGSGSGGGGGGGSIASLAIIPSAQAVASPGQTSQFLAIGTTSSGATVNLSSQVTWSSSSVQIGTIANTGLATAVGKGTTTITALYSNPSGGTVVTGTGTFTVSGGTTQQFTALSIVPGTQALSASGQTAQFIALGTSGSTGFQQDVTNSAQITWTSSSQSIVSISPTGAAKGLSAGTGTITAVLKNSDGSVVSSTANVTVTLTAAPEPLLSLTIIPSSITVGNLQDTGNFLAVGTFSSPPYVRDLTNSVTWLSSAPDVFPVSSNNSVTLPVGSTAGVVTAYGAGGATIIAEATSTDGTIQTATALFTCPTPDNPPKPGQCYPGSQARALKATITVYNEGLNTSNWLVTAPSASGTPNVIHCGPGWTGTGGSVCSAPYPFGPNGTTTVTLTAPLQTGVAFGGWSYNCAPNPVTPDPVGPNTCTVIISDTNPNVTIGAIFN